jgi:hypothetical protein
MTIIRADVDRLERFDFSFEMVLRSGFFGDAKREDFVSWTTRW